MAFTNLSVATMLTIIAVVYGPVMHGARADFGAPAPAPALANDGATIDQGIACILMLLALLLTYIIH